MNASQLMRIFPLELFRRENESDTHDQTSLERASVISKSLASILERVHPDEYAEVISFISQYPASEAQLNLLLSLAQQLSAKFQISSEELVMGSNSEGHPELDLYIRIAEDFSTFEQAKSELRDSFNLAQTLESRRVVPVILRRVSDV